MKTNRVKKKELIFEPVNLDILKTLDNGKKVIDFHKVHDLGVGINVFMTERGRQGKTFNFKEYALDRYNKHGDKSGWILNSEKQIKKDKRKFLSNNKLVDPRKWNNITVEGNVVEKKWFENIIHKNEDGGGEVETKTHKDWIMEFIPLSLGEQEKGSRDSSVQILGYDEINVGLERIKNRQTDLFMSILGTFTDMNRTERKNPLKTYLFGNYKTLKTQILTDLGILEIRNEHTYVYQQTYEVDIDEEGYEIDKTKKVLRKFKYMYLYVPDIKEQEIEEELSDDWTFVVADITGHKEHMFFNKNLYDDISSIFPRLLKEQKDLWKKQTSFIIDNKQFVLWKSTTQDNLRYVQYNPMGDYKEHVQAGTRKDKTNQRVFNKDLKIVIERIVNRGDIIYDSIVSKEAILDIIR